MDKRSRSKCIEEREVTSPIESSSKKAKLDHPALPFTKEALTSLPRDVVQQAYDQACELHDEASGELRIASLDKSLKLWSDRRAHWQAVIDILSEFHKNQSDETTLWEITDYPDDIISQDCQKLLQEAQFKFSSSKDDLSSDDEPLAERLRRVQEKTSITQPQASSSFRNKGKGPAIDARQGDASPHVPDSESRHEQDRPQRTPYTEDQLRIHILALDQELKTGKNSRDTDILKLWRKKGQELTMDEVKNIRNIALSLRDERSIVFDNYRKISALAERSNSTIKARNSIHTSDYRKKVAQAKKKGQS